jgi:hypothetical protein
LKIFWNTFTKNSLKCELYYFVFVGGGI